ncbi:MAG: tRNA glutamyl-Q(34) synthetase GluQRS [Halioglobus sp.]
MPVPPGHYRGRFAPSPTGPLHMGSLIAALASYLEAKKHRGQWLVRIDDLDPPREQAGAGDSILHALEQHGLHWDEEVLWQSRRHNAYRDALEQLTSSGHTFNCQCSRAELKPNGSCNGNCQNRREQITSPYATRLIVDANTTIDFLDQFQGSQINTGKSECSDFIVKRKDGLYAYQLAVVVDDAHQGVTHVLRGSDLLDTTARQIYLQQVLQVPTPSYAHIPVITNNTGQKFSKQNHAPALDEHACLTNLRYALAFLQQASAPAEINDRDSLLAFALEHWSTQTIPRTMQCPATPQ